MVNLLDIVLHVTSSPLDHPVKFNYKLFQNLSPLIFFVFSPFHSHCPQHGHSSITITVRLHETNVTGQLVALLLRVGEILGSNLDTVSG